MRGKVRAALKAALGVLRARLEPGLVGLPWIVESTGMLASEILLELTAEHIVDAERSQPLLVERRVKPVGTNARGRIEATRLGDDRSGQPRGRVHRQVEGNQVRGAATSRPQRFFGGVDAVDRPARRARSQAAGDARPNGWCPRS